MSAAGQAQLFERFNPKMLELARESRRMTQTALADAAGLGQGTISKIEGGLLDPSPEMVGTIARALAYPTAFFLRAGEPPARLLPREMASLPVRDRRAVIAAVKIRCLELEVLLKSVNVPEVTVPRLRLGRDVANPSEAAERVRELWRVRPGPISDMAALLEDHGVLVVVEDFALAGMDGLSQSDSWQSDLPPVIFVNRNSPGDRVRFTMAHELGHHVLHHHEHAVQATETCEDEANEFAAAFLMPERDVRHHFSASLSIEDLSALKGHWRVSMQALLVRARSTGRITSVQATRLWKRLSVLGYRTREPVDVVCEPPTTLRDIIAVYRGSLGYSSEEISTLLCLKPEEFSERYLGERKGLRLLAEWKPAL